MSENSARPPRGELEKPEVVLGFIPLTDCAPLVIAEEKGFFNDYGLKVRLSKETSWANIRDKLAIGVLDGAQMLAPMPLAMSLGIGPMQKPMVTAMNLDLNGNAITVSNALCARMQAFVTDTTPSAVQWAQALRAVIAQDQARGRPPLTFAMVFPTSMHNYLLRYWMASAGIDPDRDVCMRVVPPAQMVGNLRDGVVDGFCVGEPWNEVAVKQRLGRVLVTSYEIWNNHPEKVFGISEEWAEQNPRTHQALLMALLEACRWIDAQENRMEVAEIIAQGKYINAPVEVVKMSITGTFQYSRAEFPVLLPDFNVFHRYAANVPWRSHALWILGQMLRWGQIGEPLDLVQAVQRVYRPEILRAAAAALGIQVPAQEYKTEGQHDCAWISPVDGVSLQLGADRFFDGAVFQPEAIVEMLKVYTVHHCTSDLHVLQSMNQKALQAIARDQLPAAASNLDRA